MESAMTKKTIEDRVADIEAHLGLVDTNKDPITAEAQAEADAKAARKGAKQPDADGHDGEFRPGDANARDVKVPGDDNAKDSASAKPPAKA